MLKRQSEAKLAIYKYSTSLQASVLSIDNIHK